MSLEPDIRTNSQQQNAAKEPAARVDSVAAFADIPYPEATDFMKAFSEPLSAAEFLRRGPKKQDVAQGWPGTLWDRDMLNDEHPIYRFPQIRPTADQVLADLKQLAGTDHPVREYPLEFFTRDVIHGS